MRLPRFFVDLAVGGLYIPSPFKGRVREGSSIQTRPSPETFVFSLAKPCRLQTSLCLIELNLDTSSFFRKITHRIFWGRLI